VWEGLLETLALAKEERVKRLKAMAEKAVASGARADERHRAARIELSEQIGSIEGLCNPETGDALAEEYREAFLADLAGVSPARSGDYIGCIQGLSLDACNKGVRWLQRVVLSLCRKASESMPALGLFRH